MTDLYDLTIYGACAVLRYDGRTRWLPVKEAEELASALRRADEIQRIHLVAQAMAPAPAVGVTPMRNDYSRYPHPSEID